ncbi:MAG: RNA polymerase sigma factor SigZ [Candidatus Kapabacteria bacterium]|jgi:RNA polymerase sigma-70 factor (ECF subfamily)|nr:RNA polymerase sigma factor SigZ [Candidatus Kapabacteria bacterium]
MQKTEHIWKEYYQQLRNYIVRKIKDPAEADDNIQDVFLKIHSHIHSLKDDTKLQSWVFQITRNTIIDYYRSRNQEDSIPEWVLPDVDNENDDVKKGLTECLLPMINQLSDPYKEAVLLSEIQGYTQQEVAEDIGLSLSGAKSRIQRGRSMLKDLFTNCCQFSIDSGGHIIEYNQKIISCKECKK